MKDQAKVAFMQWVKYFSPALYAAVIKESQLAGIFDSIANIDWGGVVDKTVQLGTQYLTFDQQKDLLKMQADRAKQGLPPIQTPTATQVIIVPPQPTAQQAATQSTIDSMVRWLPWAMGALLLFKVLELNKRK